MRITLNETTGHKVAGALQELENEITRVGNLLVNSVQTGLPTPPEIELLISNISRLKSRFGKSFEVSEVEFELEPLSTRILRTAVAQARRRRAEDIDAQNRRLLSASINTALAATLAPYDELLSKTDLRTTEPLSTPRLSDYLTAQACERLDPVPPLAAEVRDPKHQVLLSAAILAQDLASYRVQCEDRRRPLSVVFADLDNFKGFNERLGEVEVDRTVLPPILSSVERATFGHGRAYRHGGDEFVVLLPNADESVAASLVTQLKTEVEINRFPSAGIPVGLSIGVWISVPNSHLTTTELIEAASHAKDASKAAGKSRITIRREHCSGYTETTVR